MNRPYRLHRLPVALAAALATQAFAQVDAPAAAASAAAPSREVSQLDAVVVTGTANPVGTKKLNASFSITTASSEQIKEAAPASTADLLKIVPGVFVETSGGEAGANIEVRGFPTGGDAPYVTMQLDGSPIYPVSTLSFMENSSLFRLDDTVERVEVLRGGPSPIWSNGQPGATVNFIQKKGGDISDGSIRLTTGTGNLMRFDGYWSGKLADGWYLSGGGFYRTENGVRNTQYPANEGGQLSFNLTHRITDGEMSFWGRATSDKNVFFTGIPLQSNASGGISGYPGIDPRFGALQGAALRNVTLETSQGGTPGQMGVDVGDGRGVSLHMLGFDFNKRIDGWAVNNKFSFMSGSAPTKALFTGATPTTLGSYITSAIAGANGQAAVTALAGNASSGTATFVGGGGITDMNTPVIDAGIWSVDKDIRAATNDLRLNKELGNGHTLSLGMYLASYSSHDVWYLGNSVLMSAQTHARPIDVVLDNGVKVTRNGFDGSSFYSIDNSYSGRSTAGTIADEWQVNKQLRLDGGLRVERQTVSGSLAQNTSCDLDKNPLTLWNNSTSCLTGAYTPLSFGATKTAYTLGAGYQINDNLTTFVRLNSGFRMPNFDDLRDNANAAVEKVKQFELGLKTATKDYHAFVTGFYNKFEGQAQTQFNADGTVLHYVLGSHTYGVEFEGAIRPFKGFELAVGGDWQKGEYVDSGASTGNQVVRQPNLQFRVTPSYNFGNTRIFMTYAQIGKRYSDVLNTQPLPSYHTLDAGAVVNVGDYEFRLTGTNLTNTLGLTEGNARVVGSGVNAGGVFIGRPIFGRAYQLSVAMHF